MEGRKRIRDLAAEIAEEIEASRSELRALQQRISALTAIEKEQKARCEAATAWLAVNEPKIATYRKTCLEIAAGIQRFQEHFGLAPTETTQHDKA